MSFLTFLGYFILALIALPVAILLGQMVIALVFVAISAVFGRK